MWEVKVVDTNHIDPVVRVTRFVDALAAFDVAKHAVQQQKEFDATRSHDNPAYESGLVAQEERLLAAAREVEEAIAGCFYSDRFRRPN